MTTQKIFWSENVKFLRNRKKLSQEELANLLKIKRTTLNAHENGHTQNPPVEILLAVSELFKISIDSLLKVNLSKLGELKMRELEAGNDVYISGGNLRVLSITVNPDNKENIEYVPVKAKAGYIAGYNDPEFIATLPRYSLPNIPKNGTYRIFPILGDSMLPIPDGSDVIAKYIEDWASIKPATPCIVILKGQQNLVFKQVTILQDGHIKLVSSNEMFQPYTAQLSEVVEIWKFHSYWTKQIPEPMTDYATLFQMVKEIKEHVAKK